MKKNCLIIFACPHIYSWEKEVITKFEIIYNVRFLFANKIFNKGGSTLLIKQINDEIALSKIDLVIFDTDYLPYIDSNIIEKVKSSSFKILLTFDNITHGNLNLINASKCNLVLAYDPLEVLLFRKYGINSLFFTLEDTKNSFKFLNLFKDIDILFYGDINKFKRKYFIDELINRGINIKVVGPPDNIVSDDEIVKLINRSKIILNLSSMNPIRDYDSFFPKSDNEINGALYSFKGRFLHAGLCKTVCISDYAPSIGLIYSEDEVPTFSNIDDCVDLINKIINNDELRNKLSENLYHKVINEFDDKKIMNKISTYIDKQLRDTLTINFSNNRYYKAYITRFKLTNAILKNPYFLFKEIIYLLKNDLFIFEIAFLPYLLKHLGSKCKRIFLSSFINNK